MLMSRFDDDKVCKRKCKSFRPGGKLAVQRKDVSLIGIWKLQTSLAESYDSFPALPFDNLRDHNKRFRVIHCVEYAIIGRSGRRLHTHSNFEKVLTKIQDCMHRRLEGKQVACLALRLPHQVPDDDPYIIERDSKSSKEKRCKSSLFSRYDRVFSKVRRWRGVLPRHLCN